MFHFLLRSCWIFLISTAFSQNVCTSIPVSSLDVTEKKMRSFSRARTTEIYVVPVVFHAFRWFQTEITAQEIDEIIVRLNEDFRKKPGTPGGENETAVDTHIEFCKASLDTEGNASNGIIHIHNSIAIEFNAFDPDQRAALMTLSPQWSRYLNIYIVEEMNSWMYGFAEIGGQNTFVVRSKLNNPLLSHEVGHVLSLYHTFEGECLNNDCSMDGDKVCDTEPCVQTLLNCYEISNSCSTDVNTSDPGNPFLEDVNDDLYNYMSYGYDCKNKFTEGQAMRMRSYLSTSPFVDHACSNTTATFLAENNGKIMIGTGVFDKGVEFTEPVTITLSDLTGKQVICDSEVAQYFSFENLINGCYMISVFNENDICFREKIFIQHR